MRSPAQALLGQAGTDVEIGFLEDEALVVPGPWPASLRAGRPFVTWVHEAGPDGHRSATVSALPRVVRSWPSAPRTIWW